MPQFEPSSDDNPSGKNLDDSCTADANPDISRTLTPESILGEIVITTPVTIIRAGAEQAPQKLLPAKDVIESEAEQPNAEFVAKPSEPEPALQESQPLPQPVQHPSTTGELSAIQMSIGHLEQDVKSMADSYVKMASEVRSIHKLYHNEFASRLKSMQDELEHYREINKGRVFDSILSEVAKLYSDNETVLDDIADPKIKKRIHYILMDIVQILEANGVFRQKSNPGDKRNTRYCQVVERITTNNPNLHDTVVQSRSTGFFIENRALIKELVDIYLYSEITDERSGELLRG